MNENLTHKQQHESALAHEDSSVTKVIHAHLIVPGMGSDHCAGLVSTSLQRLSGVGEIHTNIAIHRVDVEFDPDQLQTTDLKKAVERAGYEVDSIESEDIRELYLTVPGMGSDHCAGIISDSIHRLAIFVPTFIIPAKR